MQHGKHLRSLAVRHQRGRKNVSAKRCICQLALGLPDFLERLATTQGLSFGTSLCEALLHAMEKEDAKSQSLAQAKCVGPLALPRLLKSRDASLAHAQSAPLRRTASIPQHHAHTRLSFPRKVGIFAPRVLMC